MLLPDKGRELLQGWTLGSILSLSLTLNTIYYQNEKSPIAGVVYMLRIPDGVDVIVVLGFVLVFGLVYLLEHRSGYHERRIKHQK